MLSVLFEKEVRCGELRCGAVCPVRCDLSVSASSEPV